MTSEKRTLATLVAGITLLAIAPAQAADRRTSHVEGQLVVQDECLFTNLSTVAVPQSQEFLGVALGPILAGIGGQLAGSALTGVVDAIKRASQEHAFTATGTAGFLAGNLDRAEAGGLAPWSYVPERRCLIFHVPGEDDRNAETIGSFLDDASSRQLFDPDRRSDLLARLPNVGISDRAPDVYVEIALVPGREATQIVPALVWYREAINSRSRRGIQPVELMVELATPGMAEQQSLGTLYSVARMQLPDLNAGDAPLRGLSLERMFTQFYPNRPTAGAIDTRVAAFNTMEAAVATATTSLEAARRSLEALRNAEEPDAAQIAAAEYVLLDAQGAHAAAVRRQSAIQDQNLSIQDEIANAELAVTRARTALANAQTAQPFDQSAVTQAERAQGAAESTLEELRGIVASTTIGVANARITYIVVQNADRFGEAIGTALGAQSSALSTAVTNALTPAAEWDAERTTYVAKMTAVQAAEVAYNTALAGGDAAAIVTAHGALLRAKAEANGAAVGANLTPPYPEVFDAFAN